MSLLLIISCRNLILGSEYSEYSEYALFLLLHLIILSQLDSKYHSIVLSDGHSMAYFCFGHLLFAFISGWSERDKVKAYNLVQNMAK